jgi:hypothetical protein
VTTDPQPVPPIAEELATVERLAVRLHEEFRPLAGDVLIFEDCLEIARLAVGTLRHEVATAYDRGLAEGRQDVERLTLLLEQAEQYARDLQDGGIFLHDEAVATVRQEGLAEGRRQRDAEYDVKLGGNGTTPPPVEMVYGYNVGLAEGRRQATPCARCGSPGGPHEHWGDREPDEQPEAFDMERLAQLSISYADALEAFQHGDPARSAAALIATAVLLHQALGVFLNGVRRGRAEPASGGVVEPSPLTWTANVPYTPIVPGPNVLDLRPLHDPGALIEEPDLYGEQP